MKNLIRLVLVVSISMVSSSCANIFREGARKEFDAAYIFDAKKLMDQQDWTGALTKLALVSTAAQSDRSYKALKASAYAGRCGLNLISLLNTISSAGSTAFMPTLLNAFKSSVAANYTDCVSAETTLMGISTDPNARTADENVLIALIEWAKLGALLASTTGFDDNDDGTIDGALGACVPQFSNAQLDSVGFALTVSLASLTASASGAGGSATTGFQAACTAAASVPLAAAFCTKTDPTTQTFTADERKFIAWIIRSGDMGVGFNECNISSATLCSLSCSIP
jgi:hypothetical protein